MEAGIFETHYKEYCRRITQLYFPSIKDILGIELRGTKAVIPFFGEDYSVSATGIADEYGNRPNYGVCVILSKYLLLCPGNPYEIAGLLKNQSK